MVLACPDLSCRPNGESAGRRKWQVIQQRDPGRAMLQALLAASPLPPRACPSLCLNRGVAW